MKLHPWCLINHMDSPISYAPSKSRELMFSSGQVPYVVFEGKRRDLTLVGAKEVAEYLKTLEAVAREAS